MQVRNGSLESKIKVLNKQITELQERSIKLTEENNFLKDELSKCKMTLGLLKNSAYEANAALEPHQITFLQKQNQSSTEIKSKASFSYNLAQ